MFKTSFINGMLKAAEEQGIKTAGIWKMLSSPLIKARSAIINSFPAGGARTVTEHALKYAPSDVLLMSGIGGGLGAMASPEDRLTGGLRGAGAGALGGLIFSGARGTAELALKKLIKPTIHARLSALKEPSMWGKEFWRNPSQIPKRLGSKAVLGGVPLSAAIAAPQPSISDEADVRARWSQLPATVGFDPSDIATNL